MSHKINFEKSAQYTTNDSGITIEVILDYSGARSISQAKIDTGCTVCLFQREIADVLGIDVERGHRLNLDTLAGNMTSYGHLVTLSTFGLQFESVVYFAADYGLRRNLLGRDGWLQKVRLAIVDYDSTLYLSHYDYH